MHFLRVTEKIVNEEDVSLFKVGVFAVATSALVPKLFSNCSKLQKK